MGRQTEVYHHFDTPKKARVKGAVAYARMQKERYGHDFCYNDIFRICGVSRTRGYEIIKSPEDRTFHNTCEETRGRKTALSADDLDKIESTLRPEGCEARRLPYTELLPAAGIDKEISPHTIRRALQKRGWKKCRADPGTYILRHDAEIRGMRPQYSREEAS